MPPEMTFLCVLCGVSCTRKSRKGATPKWCSQRCADLGKKGRNRVCQRCGLPYFGLGRRFCSQHCSRVAAATDSPTIGTFYLQSDWAAITTFVLAGSVVDPSGCRLWQGRVNRAGYPVVKARGGNLLVHRLALEASRQARLGSQPAHHKCAVRRCVEVQHLQPVTAAENAAEMLARKAYVRRIAELETALIAVSPEHPLLSLIPTT